MQTKGKEDNTMKQKGLRIALLFALVLSISQAVPAFAAHKLLDANSYTLTQTERGVAISGKDGKSVTGWVQDKEGNFYYFKKGVRNSGWDKINGDWYYFYPETGVLARNTKVLNYDVDDDGRMIKVHEW